ncbi:Acyl-CoA-binding domain-containing protein 4 [Ananas comosus]|uniref:Acyl-CoA-binding domain-containing protein 4 n=1 Tax=Ananas comosus TaxID=4615 RepID=A0A199UQE9_ANACO|nr:Acyl-CoA-binding domain-containing protein 4 [Ananas comosus]
MGDKDVNGSSTINELLSMVSYDQWVLVNPSGVRPSGRYKHAAEVVEDKLYVIGGSRNGRYLADVQVFDIRSLEWSNISANMDTKSTKSDSFVSDQAFPASAGHSLVKWENKLVVVAGHSKESSDTVRVWLLDLETNSWSAVDTSGKVPKARGGQSVTLVGSRLIMFGGEDNSRRLLNDLNILNLKTMTWDLAETKKAAPAPRFDHTAAMLGNQYLLTFGGSSYSTCFNDLHILDLQTMEWSQLESQGAYVTPRGGHASTIIDEKWYIVGGGDNRSGAIETVVLNTSKFVWSVATSVMERHPLASEGLALCSTIMDGEKILMAFGGYNGKYSNELFVMKPKPINSLQPRLLQSPAAAAVSASVTAAYAVNTAAEKSIEIKHPDESNMRGVQFEKTLNIEIKIDALNAEKKILVSRIEDARDEKLRLKYNLEEMNNSYDELVKELQSVRGQLAAESARCTKLEAQIAPAKKRLESLSSLEQELEALQREKSQVEEEIAVAQRQRSGGIWQWLTGAENNLEE